MEFDVFPARDRVRVMSSKYMGTEGEDVRDFRVEKETALYFYKKTKGWTTVLQLVQLQCVLRDLRTYQPSWPCRSSSLRSASSFRQNRESALRALTAKSALQESGEAREVIP